MRLRLLAVISVALMSSLASAGSSSAHEDSVSLVTAHLVKPLQAKDAKHSKFSRARLPPSERRVRIVDATARQDSAGERFFAFAVDARHGWGDIDESAWNTDAITGCVYPDRDAVFIKRGKAFHPAAAATGKKTKPAPERTCQAAPQVSAR